MSKISGLSEGGFVHPCASPRTAGHQFAPLFLLLTCYLVAVTLPIAFHWANSAAASDAAGFHIPQINVFLSRPLDLFTYQATTATTPGYHIVLAFLMKLLGYSTVSRETLPLIAVNAAVGCVPVVLAWLIVERLTVRPWLAAGLAAPIAGSSYVISSASFVTTDNAAFSFYVLALFFLVRRPQALIGLSASLTGAVACRQIYFPIAGALALSVFDKPRPLTLANFLEPRRYFKIAAICLPSLILLGLWVFHWEGLVPPDFRAINSPALNLAVPIQAVALTGLWSFIFIIPALSLPRVLNPGAWRIIGGIGLISALLWCAIPMAPDSGAGRWGSIIWTLAAHTPAVGGRSIAVLGLILIGTAFFCTALIHAVQNHYFPAETLLLLFYLVGYSSQSLAWQRYVEPQIVLTLAVFAARLPKMSLFAAAAPAGASILSAIFTLAHLSGLL